MKVLLFKLNNISVSKIIAQVPLLDSESYGVFVVHQWAQDFTGVFCIEFNNFIDLNVLGKSVEYPGFLRWGLQNLSLDGKPIIQQFLFPKNCRKRKRI